MPVRIGDDTIRNIPEQVAKNTVDLEELKNRYDNYQSQIDSCLKKASIVNNLDSTATNRPLSANMGKTLKDMLNQAIAGVFKYKGSVATYDDLPSSGNVIGDTWNVIDTGVNYCWDGTDWDALGGFVDLSDVASLQSSNTFYAVNIFNQNVYFNADIDMASGGAKLEDSYIQFGNSSASGNTKWTLEEDQYGQLAVSRVYNGVKTTYWEFNGTAVNPKTDNTNNIGSASKRIKDIYLAGKLSDNTHSASLADLVNGIMNVINASDIVSNTLTQAQYDLITNGKPTLISGSFLSRSNGIILNLTDFGTELAGTFISGTYRNVIRINKTTLACSMATDSLRYVALSSILNINGKEVPAYPANTGTFVLKCVDGVLTWVAE